MLVTVYWKTYKIYSVISVQCSLRWILLYLKIILIYIYMRIIGGASSLWIHLYYNAKSLLSHVAKKFSKTQKYYFTGKFVHFQHKTGSWMLVLLYSYRWLITDIIRLYWCSKLLLLVKTVKIVMYCSFYWNANILISPYNKLSHLVGNNSRLVCKTLAKLPTVYLCPDLLKFCRFCNRNLNQLHSLSAS